ncbi:lactate utilization protein [Draconibacterium sp. IB214405]|uniref:LutC/YkgG family protein n=1 Tax=Draconibacterium sp. IB214405 TaxID=3097352 RepID=UPI002A1620AA|nr:lactate utilization protein [Draconibacterium sp. IB214405]MDX8338359.1 lactate utilization protein [Draconibacterium sp. IB214405]
MATAREEILNRLKKAIHPEPEKPDFDAPVYHSIEKALDKAFKENLEAVNGSVYLCNSHEELIDKLKALLESIPENATFCAEQELKELLSANAIQYQDYERAKEMEAGVTSCEFLVAHTGSVMVSSALEGGRQLSVFPPQHIVIAKREQLVDFLETAYNKIQEKYSEQLPSQITLVTGPSRTADIEKTLVMGAHGPRELHVFIY